jgi:hypothetical protein
MTLEQHWKQFFACEGKGVAVNVVVELELVAVGGQDSVNKF